MKPPANGIFLVIGLGAALAASATSGGCSSTSSLGDDVQTGGKGGAAGDGGLGDSGWVDGGCPSNVLCGPQATCCPVGNECFEGACVAACSSGVHCLDTCCTGSEICVTAGCVTPTTPCVDSVDCAGGEYCEQALGKCLPEASNSPCTIKPPVVPLTPTLKWSFTTPTVLPTYDQAISAPLVVDVVTPSGHSPAVFFTASDAANAGGAAFARGFLRRIDGATGLEAWGAGVDAFAAQNELDATFAPAVADLDGDGVVEVVAMAATGELIAFDGNGALEWRSKKKDGSPYIFPILDLSPPGPMAGSAIAVADMDADGKGETVLGGVVFDSTGVVISGEGRELAGAAGSVAISVIADVDADGKQDVVTGNAAYRLDGSAIWSNPSTPDGFPALADFEKDGVPELVVTSGDQLRVLDAKTGTQRAAIGLPGGAGSPVIADFSGSGVPEIGVQYVCAMAVYTFDGSSLTNKWTHPLTSCSGTLTATAFDFNGDGEAEVLAHDDCRIVVLSGSSGQSVLSLASSHATWTEFVSVTDIDGNGVADMLFSSNDAWGNGPAGIATICGYQSGEQASHGVFVYSDPNEKWMPTRRVWNEQSYHITNIKADGTLPQGELASWGPGGYNNYRVSAQGKGTVSAPDLVVTLSAGLGSCPSSLELDAVVKNQGSAGVAAGIQVDFYQGTAPGGTLLGSANTTTALLPGASEKVTLTVVAPTGTASYYATVDPSDVVPECVSDNNTGAIAGVNCPEIR